MFMPIQKQVANRVLANLDETANRIDALAKAGKLDPRLAKALSTDIDTFADKFQVAAFGPESLKRHATKVAKVIQKDSDEKYMDTFENPNKVIQSDADEPYMHKTDQSFNAGAIDNYDQDRTVTVSDRDEFAVRDLSEWSEKTKKQPSWSKGPAGKSTKQGSAKPAAKPGPGTRTAAAGKTWSA
jgi:hypothetical protein